jgi:hypothetical protein
VADTAAQLNPDVSIREVGVMEKCVLRAADQRRADSGEGGQERD